MILSEGWLNVEHTRASIIKIANTHVFELKNKKNGEHKVKCKGLHLAACISYYCFKNV